MNFILVRLGRIASTSVGWEFALLRLAVAVDLGMDGIRASGLHWAVGNTRLALLDARLPGFAVEGLGWLEVFLAIGLACGLATRPIAAVAMWLPLLAGLGAYNSLFSLEAAARLDVMVHSWAVVLVAGVLVLRGGGSLSLDRAIFGGRTRR